MRTILVLLPLLFSQPIHTYNYTQRSSKKSKMEETPETPQPLTPDRQFQIEELTTNKITHITSVSVTPTRKFILLTTEKGFVLVTPQTTQFNRFQDKHSPFYKNKFTPHGAALGSMLQKRTEVALMPNFSNKKFKKTAVYIYDYSIKILLSSFDFILPVTQFTITDRFLVSSNNKRILLYNYLKGDIKNSELEYIQAFKSKKQNNYLRYLQLHCHRQEPEKIDSCQCGQYSLARLTSYLKIFYLQVSVLNNETVIYLYQYDQASEKAQSYLKQSLKNWGEYSTFKVTEEGKYLTIVEEGTTIKVYNVKQKLLQSVLYLGRNPRSILNLGVLTLPDKSEVVIASRQKPQIDEVTVHIFKLGQTSPTDHIESKYKRYFRMYRELLINEEVFADKNKLLGPQYFVVKEKIFSLSLEGEYCEVIDLNRAGLHPQMTIKDYRRLEDITQPQLKDPEELVQTLSHQKNKSYSE